MTPSKRSLPVLILLNAVLVAALSVTTFAPPAAEAQLGSAGGQYLMVSGQTRGREQQDAIYILDLRSSRIAAVFFNGGNDELELIAGTTITSDVPGGAGGGR